MHLETYINKLISVMSFSTEVWMSLLLGAIVTLIIAYIIYKIQKKESTIHKQDHDAKLDRLEQLHLQDSEKINVLYELIIQSQKGNIGEIEATVLEEKIEIAADQITEADSDHAQALKAIAEKDKGEADDLLDKITQREHDLVEVYNLHAMNESRNGFYYEAVKWYRKAAELEPDNSNVHINLINTLNNADMQQEARELALKMLDSLEKSGSDDPETTFNLLMGISNSYDVEFETEQLEPYILRLQEHVRQHFGEQSPQMSGVYNELGRLYHEKNQFKESEECYLKSLDILNHSGVSNTRDSSVTTNNLATLYRATGRYQEALELLEKVKQNMTVVHGEGHLVQAFPIFNQSMIYQDLGKFKEAEDCLLKAKDLFLEKLGANHTNYIKVLQNLAGLYRDMHRYAESEAITRELLGKQAAIHGEDSIQVALLWNQLSVNLSIQYKTDEAEEALLKAIKIYDKVLSPDDTHVIIARHNMAYLYLDKGNYEKARLEWLDLLETLRQHGLDYCKETATIQVPLAGCCTKMDLWSEAEQHLRRALDFIEVKTPDNPNNVNIMELYSQILAKLGRQDEADTYKAKAEALKVRFEQETGS